MIYDDGIVLIKTNGKYILIDNIEQNIYLLKKNSFDILHALKTDPIEKVEAYYSKESVNKVKTFIDGLIQARKCSLPYHDDWYRYFENNTPCITEGVFMVAQQCNMNCKYCFGGEGQYGARSMMSRDVAKRSLLQLIGLSSRERAQRIVFLGGEPLLNFDVIKYVVDQWNELQNNYPNKNVRFAFTTNGTMFTQEIVDFIKDNQVGVTISLDGPPEIQNKNRKFKNSLDTYERVFSGMKMLEAAKVDYSVRATLTSDTDLDVLYSYFEKYNFKNTRIVPVDYPMEEKSELYQWDFNQYKSLKNKEKDILALGYKDIINGNKASFKAKQMMNAFNELDRRIVNYPFKCSAGWWSVVFSSDGNIYPCHRLVGNKRYLIGDVDYGLYIEKIRQILGKGLKRCLKCESCEAFIFCKRRCISQLEFMHDDMYTIPKELCAIYKEEFVNKLDLFLELKKKMRSEVIEYV